VTKCPIFLSSISGIFRTSVDIIRTISVFGCPAFFPNFSTIPIYTYILELFESKLIFFLENVQSERSKNTEDETRVHELFLRKITMFVEALVPAFQKITPATTEVRVQPH
jgi:hypothetical protein